MRDSGGIVIPPDVRLAGEALRERELTSDQHRQKTPLTEKPSCEAEDPVPPDARQVGSICQFSPVLAERGEVAAYRVIGEDGA